MADKLVTIVAPSGEQVQVDADEAAQYLADHPGYTVVPDEEPKGKRARAED